MNNNIITLKKWYQQLFLMIIRSIGLLIISTFFWAAYLNYQVDVQISAFKSRSSKFETIEILHDNGAIETRMYHPIARTSNYEISDNRSIFEENKLNPNIGQNGDIFVTKESPFPSLFGFHQLMSFYVGGHAALKDGNQVIEAVGFPAVNEKIIDIIKDPSDGTHSFNVGVKKRDANYWVIPNFRNENHKDFSYYGSYYRKKFIVLRVKNIDVNELELTLDYANEHVNNESLYNFLFFFDKHNKFYCTDLISRSFRHAKNPKEIDTKYPRTLNDNGFVTTVNDLILSKSTYLTAYVENIDGLRHVYYLSDV